MESLIHKLREYSKSDYYGFHMPGHKRNIELCGSDLPYGIDITEIEGFDDLHHCEGILLAGQERASKIFGADKTSYLINGSTAGNMSAIMSVTNYGDKILIARNNHKSVYNAVFLKGLKPVYIYPQFDEENSIIGEISCQNIEDMLIRHPDIKAVVIVSPTYDGVVSDIEKIARAVHQHEIPLIVDEAHGAHFGFHEYFPRSANQLGADLVVHSVHKTLPSLTQTGLLHVNGSLVDYSKVKRYLSMLQSSSPSYVLMSSIERCVSMIEVEGDVLFNRYAILLMDVRDRLKKLKNLKLIETETYDPSKIVISTKNCNMKSQELYEVLLNRYHLQMEMVAATYVTAMTSVADTEKGLERLVSALDEIDQSIEKEVGNSMVDSVPEMLLEFPRLPMAEEGEQGSEWFYYLYPPGIPFIVPGEQITDEVRRLMSEYEAAGFVIQRA